jgi:hypothetical protein
MPKEQQNADGQPEQEIVVDPNALKVDEELRRLIPAHKKSEIALLERNILEVRGCREALPVWEQKPGEYTVLDGHTRRGLCIKHGFQVRIRKVEIKDKAAAKEYVKKLQLGRRNTPDHAESYLRGSHYNDLKQGHGGNRRSKDQGDLLKEAGQASTDQPDPLKDDTAEKLAKEYEVGSATIKRDGQFARLLDAVLQQAGMEDKRWQLLGGDMKLNRAVVKKLSTLKGKELKKHLEHLLKEGRLPRKERTEAAKASAKEVAKSKATAFVTSLKAKDEQLPLAVLKEMAALLGCKVVEAEPKKTAKAK